MAVGESTTTSRPAASGTVRSPASGPPSAVSGPPSAVLVEALLGAVGAHFDVRDLEWARLDPAGLRAAAEGLQRGISALEHQQRHVLGVIDEQRAFSVDGSRDAADWSANNLGISRKAANDRLRLGRDLAKLPNLQQAAASGELTADQAHPAVELAKVAGTDHGWATQAPHLPVGVLTRHAAKSRRPGAADRRAAHAARHLHTWIEGLEMRFRGSLPTDEGARLLAAVERAIPERDPHTDTGATPDQRRADGLAALAAANLAADSDPDRATVVAIVELAAICDDDPTATAELETSQPLATETARRLLCDARIQVIVQDRTGVAVGVGTTARVVTPAMRRVLMRRDGGCRFGQCTNTRHLHAHHITPWPSPTQTGNLALLCWHHHHTIHEGGWTLTGDPNHALHATNPTGTTTITSHPHHWHPPGTDPPGLLPPGLPPPTTVRPEAHEQSPPARSPAHPTRPPPRVPSRSADAPTPGRAHPDPAHEPALLFAADTS